MNKQELKKIINDFYDYMIKFLGVLAVRKNTLKNMYYMDLFKFKQTYKTFIKDYSNFILNISTLKELILDQEELQQLLEIYSTKNLFTYQALTDFLDQEEKLEELMKK